jgi:excisionase family DNA binding protein
MPSSILPSPNGDDAPSEYLTKREVQAILHVSLATLNRLLADHEIDVVRVGRGRGSVRITRAALRDYTERNTHRAAANRPRGK